MRAFVHNHPHLSDFMVLIGVILLSMPLWGVAWAVLAYTGHVTFEAGCQIRTGCYYDSMNFIVVAMLALPIFFSVFIFQVTRIAKWMSNSLLRWAGLNPDVALG